MSDNTSVDIIEQELPLNITPEKQPKVEENTPEKQPNDVIVPKDQTAQAASVEKN